LKLACRLVPSQRYVSPELHHFVGAKLPDDDRRYQTLLNILRSGRLRPGRLPGDESPEDDPRGVALAIRPGAEEAEEMVRAEVVCFCDIPADDLGLHMTKYGPFGISFPKIVHPTCEWARPR
jgi:hypothetical protein